MITETVKYGTEEIRVQVTGTFTTGDGRKMASIRALEGEPFVAWTHGGWASVGTVGVNIESLRDWHQVEETDEPK